MKRILLAGLALVLMAAATAGAGIGLAAAQGEDNPAQTFLARVAAKLGIGEDELRSAMTEAQQDIIDEQVAAGRLTAEQGERLKEHIAEHGPLGPLDRLRLRERACQQVGRLTVKSAATALGMEPKDLVSELKDGKTLAQIAQERGLAVEDFKTALLQDVQRELNGLVAEGKLTEDQADAIYERIEKHIDRIVDGRPEPLHRRCAPPPGLRPFRPAEGPPPAAEAP